MDGTRCGVRSVSQTQQLKYKKTCYYQLISLSGAQSIVCQIETFLAPSFGTLGRATKMALIG
jgi:hypothetical protein